MSRRARRRYHPLGVNRPGIQRLNAIVDQAQAEPPLTREQQLQKLAELYGTHTSCVEDLFDQAEHPQRPVSP